MHKEKIKKILLFVIIWLTIINVDYIFEFIWLNNSNYIGNIFFNISNFFYSLNINLSNNLKNVLYLFFNYELANNSFSILIFTFILYLLNILITFLIAGFLLNPLVIIFKAIKNKNLKYKKIFADKITKICGFALILFFSIFLSITLFSDQIKNATQNKALGEYNAHKKIPRSSHICDLIDGHTFWTYLGFQECFPIASDTGKECTDDSQCTKFCVVINENDKKGKCFKYVDMDECNMPNHISNGKFISKGGWCVY